MFEQNKASTSIVRDVRDAFCETMLPAIMAGQNRVGMIGERANADIAKRVRTDTRIPLWFSISGKGSPGHEDWTNVTLFDHTSSVAMAAAAFTVTDCFNDGSIDEVRQWAAVAFMTGMLHDTNKLLGKANIRDVTETDIETIYTRYRVEEFLARFSLCITPAQMLTLISCAEVGTTDTLRGTGGRIPDMWRHIARKFVRFADMLDGEWLKGAPGETVEAVAEIWNREVRARFRSDNFSHYRALIISDPHHPFLLADFARTLEGICEDETGRRPLFHAVADGVMSSLLPTEEFDNLVEKAANDLADNLPFRVGFEVSPAGIPKTTGAVPSFSDILGLVKDGISTGDSRRLLAVKVTDFTLHEPVIRALALAAGCPFVATNKALSGKTMPIIRSINEGDAGFGETHWAAVLSFTLGVKESAKARKQLSSTHRETALRGMLGDIPPFLDEVDALTRRTCLALLTAAKMASDDNLRIRVLTKLKAWFEPDGLFVGAPDIARPVRTAVKDRFLALSRGIAIQATSAEHYCLITGEPVCGPSITAIDGLYGIKSSAISYREGRSESRFSEEADVRNPTDGGHRFRLMAGSQTD